MNHLAMNADPAAVLASALETGIRASVLLRLALGAQWLVGRRRTLIRLAIGHACLAGLLLLPAAIVVLPGLDLACLPAMAVPDSGPGSGRIEEADPAGRESSEAMQGPPAAPSEAEDGPIEAAGLGVAGIPAGPRESGGEGPPIDPLWWGMIAYSAVSLLLMLRLAISLAGVAYLKGRSVPVEEPEWLDALGRWRQQLGIRRGVGLAWSPDVGVPVVVGAFRPAILLPIALTRPEGGRHRDAVILHELSHVRRSDFAWNLILRFVQAVYWLHPLVWPLGAIIVTLRERACDAHCVALLGGARRYREALLDVAAGAIGRPGPALGLAMSRASSLERRLGVIRRSAGEGRCLSPAGTRGAIGGAVLGAAALIGMIRPVAPEAGAGAAKPGVLRLVVISADTGESIPRAEVRILMEFKDRRLKADDRGCLEIRHSSGAGDRNISIDIWADGYAMQRHSWGDPWGRAIPERAEVRLHAGTKLGGIVRDEQGRPIAGAAVHFVDGEIEKRDPHERLDHLGAMTGPDGRWTISSAPKLVEGPVALRIAHPDFISDRQFGRPRPQLPAKALRSGEAVSVMKRGMPIVGRVIDAGGRPVVGAVVAALPRGDRYHDPEEFEDFGSRTDAEGMFRSQPVEPGGFTLAAKARGHSAGLAVADPAPGVMIPVEIRLGKPRTISGRVVDPEGKPVAGACVAFAEWKGIRSPWATLIADADGRFRWDEAPDGEVSVVASKPGYLVPDLQPFPEAGGGHTLVLRPGFSVSGNCRDADDGGPVRVERIEAGVVEPETGRVASWKPLPKGGYSATGGMFALELEGSRRSGFD